VGENRILAHFGLTGLKGSKLQGIQALIASAGLNGAKLDSVHVGFLLAPRLNACGRMGHARLAVEMLTNADTEKANEIATYLEQQNRQRQSIEAQDPRTGAGAGFKPANGTTTTNAPSSWATRAGTPV